MFSLNRLILHVVISVISLAGAATACEWEDMPEQGGALEILTGHCLIPDLLMSDALDLKGETLHVKRSIVVKPDAALTISGDAISAVRLHSSRDDFANIVAEGALLRIQDVTISSYNPEDGEPDRHLKDGRSFIRVESFVRPDRTTANGRLEVKRSEISFLGYDSRIEGPAMTSTYGVSLKVLGERHLRAVSVTGFIKSSDFHNNYRGFYSFGASNFRIEDSRFFENIDYGIDGHDDTDFFKVERNEIFKNGGTGLICSRRCNANVFSGNTVYANGANGIMLHDLSNRGIIEKNVVRDNMGDGIVVHDSHSVVVRGNIVTDNRIGVRVFAGSVDTRLEGNRISGSAKYSISLLEGSPERTQLLSLEDGPQWNGWNLARHNDSRVWFTVIKGNVFPDDASIRITGSVGAVLQDNRFLGRQSFRVANSKGTRIDSSAELSELPGPVKPPAHALARLSRWISSDDRSPIALDGDVLQVPAGSGPYYLELTSDGDRILVHEDLGQTRTAEIVNLPIKFHGGSGRILAARNTFGIRPTLELRIKVSQRPLSLSLSPETCAVSEWRINGTPYYAEKDEAIRIPKNPFERIVEISCIS